MPDSVGIPFLSAQERWPSAKVGEDVKLDSRNPKKSLEYYYQVRCNITHRGKAANRDVQRLQDCLNELLVIFRACLDAAFTESNAPLAPMSRDRS